MIRESKATKDDVLDLINPKCVPAITSLHVGGGNKSNEAIRNYFSHPVGTRGS